MDTVTELKNEIFLKEEKLPQGTTCLKELKLPV